jgi:hypothetical protein
VRCWHVSFGSGRASSKEVTREGSMKGECLIVERQVMHPGISSLTIGAFARSKKDSKTVTQEDVRLDVDTSD